ncbi:MAG: hypothetical protein IPO99_16120 [Nitrospira sp.]|nr:hypothetical protein [Nitrospira sp.]
MATNKLQALLRRLFRDRTIRVTTEGIRFLLLTLAVGIAAVNTGNNLFYLLLAMMLSLVVLSGLLSEQCVRRLTSIGTSWTTSSSISRPPQRSGSPITNHVFQVSRYASSMSLPGKISIGGFTSHTSRLQPPPSARTRYWCDSVDHTGSTESVS